MRGKRNPLSSEEIEQVTRELLEGDAELDYDQALHGDIVTGVLRRDGQLSTLLHEEAAAVEAARRGWRGPSTIAIFAVLAAAASLLYSVAFGGVRIPTRSQAVDVTISLGLVVLGTLAALWRWNLIRRRIRLTAAELRAALLPPLRALIRVIISELLSDELNWSNTLRTTEAPALVELNIQDTVPSTTYKRLRAFIDGHESSAIGLAGSRGSGKTTVMRQLMLDRASDCHVAVVTAPVRYSPTEFTRLIHGALARTGVRPPAASFIRDRVGAPTLRAITSVTRAIFVLVTLVALTTLWFYDRGRPKPKPLQLDWSEFAAILIGVLITGFLLDRAWSLFQGRARLMLSARTAQELCRQQLDFLRWSASVEASAKYSVKIGGSALEGLDKVSRTERELTHAEAVEALRQFIDRLVALSGKSVIICVDELDKLANPDDAIDAINGMKDLFHISRGHFVLSVSTDAMHSFAARGVPVRDVFDSAFDTIIPVSPLTVEESQTLISRRARDFSRAMVLFCHAWSGGHARDLIRTSRSCVDVRCELGDEEATVAGIAERVIRADLREVVGSTIQRLRGEAGAEPESEALLNQVLAFQEAIEDEGTSLYEVTRLGESFDGPAGATTEAQQLGAALAPYARIAGLCERLFSVPRRPDQWRSEPMRAAVVALADARGSLWRHPREIQRRLDRAVDACREAADPR